MFDRYIPHALILGENPVFIQENRRVHWPRSVQDLKRYTWNTLIGVHVVVLGTAVLARLAYGTTLAAQRNYYGGFYLLVIFANLGITLVADLYNVLMTVAIVNHEVSSRAWDVRLTNVDERMIVSARYANAQIRAWRMLVLEIAFRILAIVLLPFFLALEAILTVAMSTLNLVAGYMFLVAVVGVVVAFLSPIIYLVCVAEPIWRMRALTALGIEAALETRSLTLATLLALGAWLAVRSLQFGLLLAAAAPLVSPRFTQALCLSSDALLLVLAYFVLSFEGYRQMRRIAIRRANRLAFRSD
jgi:hypothetical protein